MTNNKGDMQVFVLIRGMLVAAARHPARAARKSFTFAAVGGLVNRREGDFGRIVALFSGKLAVRNLSLNAVLRILVPPRVVVSLTERFGA
jgi:hypothetical protein